MSQDLHHNIKSIRCISPVAIGTTGTGQVGKVVDRRGFESVEFEVSYGAITATGAVFTTTVKEGDATGTMTSVADTDLLGTEANAGLAATTPRTSGASKLVTKRIGYKGIKRYVSLSVKSTVTAGTPICVNALLGGSHNRPVAT